MASMLFPLNDLRAIEHKGTITFGLRLPCVAAVDGNAVTVVRQGLFQQFGQKHRLHPAIHTQLFLQRHRTTAGSGRLSSGW